MTKNDAMMTASMVLGLGLNSMITKEEAREALTVLRTSQDFFSDSTPELAARLVLEFHVRLLTVYTSPLLEN